MNNRRAGLYSFASTTTWLHETGMASPPLLVVLGLTLPDSRILSGIASIGLTLANIAIILPHLRQPRLHVLEGALAHEQSTQEQINLSPDGFNTAQPVFLLAKSPVLASASPREREHQSPHFTCTGTVKLVCSADTEPLGYPNVESEVASQSKLRSPTGKTDDDPIPPIISPSLDADPSEGHPSSSHLFARERRSALYIPLPVPDVEEVAFFDTEDTTLFKSGLGEECPVAACEQHTAPDEHSTIEDYGPTSGKGIEQGGQLVTTDLPSTQGRDEIGPQKNLMVASGQFVADWKVAPPPTKVTARDHHSLLVEGTTFDPTDGLPTRADTVQNAQAKHALVAGEKFCRPESLEFIPQSVMRRYPSALMVSAVHCLGHRAFSSRHDYQIPPAPPRVFIRNPVMLLDGTRANNTTLPEGHWHASFLTEVLPTRRSMGGRTFVIETVPAHDPFKQEPASLPEPPTVLELTPPRENPIRRHRLGVIARAALRDRRSAAHRRRDDGDDGSSTSDSDLDFDSDSQYSSESSAYESMLPHMLGADLIAAIDANSEPELNLTGPGRTMHTSLDVYEDFLISDDSAADVSMIMHVSSNDDASGGEARARATFRSLTYEDIQQWASGVVQKCATQVCRSRVSAEPLSPSQASDVCAERPSGSGVSQCPLSGLHCKLGAVALAEVPVQRTKELPVSLRLPPTSTLPSLQVRKLRDIPEFVPRPHISMISRRIESPRRLSTRSTIDVTRDAATQVIARMESQVGFNTGQWLVGTEERRMVNTTGGRHGALGRYA